MGEESRFRVKAWRWPLRFRLLWSSLVYRGNAEQLAKVTEHILQSHHVQHSDLAGARKGRDRFDVLSIAAEQTRSLAGMAMEFGVFQGITLRHIARAIAPERRVTGFDTFEGLPDDWGDLLAKGTFATAMPSFEGLSNVALEVGRIEDTLPKYLSEHRPTISLVHSDCPYYEINVFILEHVLPSMPAGSVVVFDEYYGYPSYEQHEFRAWSEIRQRMNLKTIPIAYSSRSAAFRIERNPLHAA
jgi:Methyltransferase domain